MDTQVDEMGTKKTLKRGTGIVVGNLPREQGAILIVQCERCRVVYPYWFHLLEPSHPICPQGCPETMIA